MLHSGVFSDLAFFSPPRMPPPAAETCQAGASQSRGVRGHQLESHPRPGEPAAQLATGSGMSDFLHGVTAVCVEVSATSQYAPPFSVWQGRPHLNSKDRSNVTNKFTWFCPRCSCDQRGELGERDSVERAGPAQLMLPTLQLKLLIDYRTISLDKYKSLKTQTQEFCWDEPFDPTNLSALHAYGKNIQLHFFSVKKKDIRPFLVLFWKSSWELYYSLDQLFDKTSAIKAKNFFRSFKAAFFLSWNEPVWKFYYKKLENIKPVLNRA